MTYTNRLQHASQLLIGATLLLIGTALLLDNLALIDIGDFWRHWPLLVMAVGIGKLVQAENPYERGKALWWVFIGGWLYISILKLFGLGFRESWPLLLVGWGASTVWKSFYPPRRELNRRIS